MTIAIRLRDLRRRFFRAVARLCLRLGGLNGAVVTTGTLYYEPSNTVITHITAERSGSSQVLHFGDALEITIDADELWIEGSSLEEPDGTSNSFQ